MLGYTRNELLELSVQQVSHPDDRLATEKERLRVIAGETDSFKAEKRYLRKDGRPIWVHITVATRRGVDGRRLHDVSIVEDITERRDAQNRVQFLATHDEMTGLANRTLFNELLSNAIARDRRYGRRFAVLFIDLDRFKIINDSLGHEGGDQLLKEMASRLKANVRESDVLARFGGDEFALLAQEVPDRQTAALIARNLLLLALRPVRATVDGRQPVAALGKTLGVTIVAEGVETSEQQAFLQRRACHEMQGFHFSRPIPPEQFAEFYRTHARGRQLQTPA